MSPSAMRSLGGRPTGPHPARPRPARWRWLDRHPARPARRHHADPCPDRSGPRARQGRRARGRGRRLRHEAVRACRASRPGGRAAAAGWRPGRRSGRHPAPRAGRPRCRAARGHRERNAGWTSPRASTSCSRRWSASPAGVLTKGRLLRAVWGTAYSDRGALPARVRQPPPAQARCGRSDRTGQRPDRRRTRRRIPDRRGRASRLERLLSAPTARAPSGLLAARPRVRSWTRHPVPGRARLGRASAISWRSMPRSRSSRRAMPTGSDSSDSATRRPLRRSAWPTRRSPASGSGGLERAAAVLTLGPRE